MIYQTDETTISLLQLITRNNGTLDTGETLYCFIINNVTGVVEIAGGTVTEVAAGIYQYMWTHGKTTNGSYSWYFKSTNTLVAAGIFFASGTFRIVTTKKELTDTIDFADGIAI